VIAFKWLQRGAVGPFSGFRWPRAQWVTADAREGYGIHACRVDDLPFWISDELWRVELDEVVAQREAQVEARRGRLVEQVQAWDAAAFAQACAAHAAEIAGEASPYVADARRRASQGFAGPASYISAVAAVAASGDPRRYAEERRWQARWLARELKLDQAGALTA